VDLQAAWRPFPALTVSVGPSVKHNVVAAQYLATIPDALATRTFGSRYVFGELDQTEVSMTTRLNVATSPRTSARKNPAMLLTTPQAMTAIPAQLIPNVTYCMYRIVPP
jgi:hypothetical protein